MSELLTKSLKNVTRYQIWSAGVTEPALEMLDQSIIDATIIPEEYTRAYLCWKKVADDKPDDPDEYPLKCYSADGNKEVWVSGIATGYRGTGPHGAVQALMIMGFIVNPEDVFQLPMGTEKVFEK